jgi:hypothetical protein
VRLGEEKEAKPSDEGRNEVMQWSGISEGVNKAMLADDTRLSKRSVSYVNGSALVAHTRPWLPLCQGKHE